MNRRTTPREHGTHAKYVVDRCRCVECRAANRDYERERSRRLEPAYVSAGPARAHIAELRAAGMGLKRIAAVSGVSTGGLSKLIYGDSTRGRGPSKRIRRETEERILAVTPRDRAGGSRVPAGPVLAQVERLVAAGMTKAEIGRRIGQAGSGLQLGDEVITARNARAIAALVAELDAGTLVFERRSRWGTVTETAPDVEPVAAPPARDDVDDLMHTLADILEARIDQSDWRRQAACVGRPTYLWMPAPGDRNTARAAQKICSACTVRDDCLAANLDQAEGIFGGLTARRRRTVRAERSRVPERDSLVDSEQLVHLRLVDELDDVDAGRVDEPAVGLAVREELDQLPSVGEDVGGASCDVSDTHAGVLLGRAGDDVVDLHHHARRACLDGMVDDRSAS